MDYTKCAPDRLGVIEAVVDSLASAGFDTASMMLVGAEARDILHQAQGHTFALSATSDLDMGIAIPDWNTYSRIVKAFAQIGDTGIRYVVAEIKVDFLPFGSNVEDPSGVVSPPQRGEPMSVFGFREVFDRADILPLHEKLRIRIPTVAGYTALKLKAWIDRSGANWETKDGPDLALAAFCYAHDLAVQTRLYSHESDVLQACGYDVQLASAQLVGHDAMATIGETLAGQLRRQWATTNRQLLARNFVAKGVEESMETQTSLVDNLSLGINRPIKKGTR